MAKAKKKSRSKFAQVRHPFLYEMHTGGGKVTKHKAWAKVIHAKRPVELTLTQDAVKKSMKLGGVGNTSSCSMAVCTYNHADAFPHSVEGHVDFGYARCFVVSKIDGSGLPSECYAYEHAAGWIAKLNDSPGGQRKLLEMIKKDGPMTVELKPVRYRSKKGRPGNGRKATGTRDALKLKGARLRYAVYKLGAMPADEAVTAQ